MRAGANETRLLLLPLLPRPRFSPTRLYRPGGGAREPAVCPTPLAFSSLFPRRAGIRLRLVFFFDLFLTGAARESNLMELPRLPRRGSTDVHLCVCLWVWVGVFAWARGEPWNSRGFGVLVKCRLDLGIYSNSEILFDVWSCFRVDWVAYQQVFV